jgi:hypothetical protein
MISGPLPRRFCSQQFNDFFASVVFLSRSLMTVVRDMTVFLAHFQLTVSGGRKFMKPSAHIRLALMFLISALILFSTPSWSQSLTSGDITGTVLDPSGAAVANATVTLTNKDTGTTQTTTTNSTGAYRFSLLNPGKYSLSVAAQVFRPWPNTS